MDGHYNTAEAIEAQAKLCGENGLPVFAPASDGRCYSCGNNIYMPIAGSNSGITVEDAGKRLITSCPHCCYSFTE